MGPDREHTRSGGDAVAGRRRCPSVVLAGAGALGAQTFRTSVDLASFGVTVVDRKGGLVTDLTAADFEVYEDGKPQEINLFARGDSSSGDGIDRRRRNCTSACSSTRAAAWRRTSSSRGARP